MIRLAIFIVFVSCLAVIAVTITDEPGRVVLVWGDWLVETSPAVLAGLGAIISIGSALLFQVLRWVWVGPRSIARARSFRRQRRGYIALTQGFVSAAAGDSQGTRRLARRANLLLDEPPLTLLLSAQAAQLEGEDDLASTYFQAMLEMPETEFLGLRGLLVQANKAGDNKMALSLAERAFSLRPNTPWVLTTLLELQTRAADWPGALSTLRIVRKQKVLGSDICNIREAGILLEQARLAGSSGDSNLTSRLAESAYNTKKDFVAAIIFLASHYLSIAQHTKAEKIILQAWNKSPHPSLAKYFNEACASKDGTSRAKQLKKLAERNRNHPESLLILASVALEAKLWGSARSHLEAILKVRPTAEIYRRLAYLEEVGYDDSKAARKWLLAASEAEADPTWTCKECGISAQEWTIICSFCGTIDTMEWGQTRQNRNLLNASTNLFTEEKENSTSGDLARSDDGDVVVPNSDKMKIEMT